MDPSLPTRAISAPASIPSLHLWTSVPVSRLNIQSNIGWRGRRSHSGGAAPGRRRSGSMAARYDAVVVGAGHNGLVAAAYLARSGARTLVLEARGKTGGAATTHAPWPDAPEFRVTPLSYVM